MASNICIFEDEKYDRLLPVAWTRPIFDLRCGINTLADKIRRAYPRVNTYIFCRDYLEGQAKRRYSGAIVNKLGKDSSTLFINGRVVFNKELAAVITATGTDEIFDDNGLIVAARLSRENLDLFKAKLNKQITNELLSFFKERVKVTRIEVRSVDLHSDLVNMNGEEIGNDFADRFKGGLIKGVPHPTVIFNQKNKIFIDDGCKIGAYAVLDASDGPVCIGKGATIHHHTVIEGPAYIGDNSFVHGHIRKNTSIGPNCKIGGEISSSIFHGNSNKAHYGYIGNSYIGEWVNLGAGTTNSNLKNNYGNIKIQFLNEEVDSKMMFLGAAIADHVKTGIGTLINSGSVIGAGSNIFGGGITAKCVPSFSWGGGDEFTVHEIEKAIKTAEAAMKRRGIEMVEDDRILFRKIFELTVNERTGIK